MSHGFARVASGERHFRRVWLFDLDNTLHDASARIFPRINQAMTTYIGHHLKLDEAAATRLRQTYWERYGATLLGLMRHHGTDPGHFLHQTHLFDDLARLVVGERALKAALRRLPGRKILFSNAPRRYAEAVLAAVGIRSCFAAIFSIESLRFRPKPDIKGFRHLLHKERLDPRACIMVEDSLHNLETAKRLGMKTVWIHAGTRHPPCVDVKIASILDLSRRLGRL